MILPSKNRSGLHSTLRERITDAIRDAIIKGQLGPGERLSEPELAGRYGISRTPVREALRQLESEGFLIVTPRKGARVTQLTTKDVDEFYDLKALMEGYAARIATPTITEKELTRMAQLNDLMDKYHQSGDLRRIAKVHNEFHDAIVLSARNQQLYVMMQVLINRFQRFTIQLALAGRNPEACEQHREIIAAMKRRDAAEAERLVRANAMLGRELMIEMVVGEDRR